MPDHDAERVQADIHPHVHFDPPHPNHAPGPPDPRLDLILGHLHHITESIRTMSGSVQTSIDQIIADNAELKAAVDGAPAAIAALIAKAIADQANAGVTPAQMQSLADLHTALGGELAQLNAALAGTPPAVATPTFDPSDLTANGSLMADGTTIRNTTGLPGFDSTKPATS